MSKTDFKSDKNIGYNHLDVVLIRSKGGWKNGLSGILVSIGRWLSGQHYDKCALVFSDTSGKNLLTVEEERAMVWMDFNKFRGHLNLVEDVKVINLPIHHETHGRAQKALGKFFNSSAHFIAHVFCLADATKATPHYLLKCSKG